MRTVTIASALAALAAVTASAAEEPDVYSASYMVPYCELTTHQIELNVALAFENGRCIETIRNARLMVDLMRQAKAAGDDIGRLKSACADIPYNLSNVEVQDRVIHYIESWPDQMREPFFVLAAVSMRSIWPCKE
jgi:hypothetical protein